MIPWLDDLHPEFPPVDQALIEPDGLLCAGGNLSVATLVSAYQQGIFPWFSGEQPILWWSPNPRMVLTPDTLLISKSLRKLIRKQHNSGHFCLTVNRDFLSVIKACAETRKSSGGTWITSDMQSAYFDLHRAGFAHSIEVWSENNLAGGLYGIAIGHVFFGESMFSRQSNTSKLALVALLRSTLFELVDCQVHTSHLASLGAHLIERPNFLNKIGTLSRKPTRLLTTESLQ
ncbi:MAG: leucyl/phenylalanyl-tRNA--protein transferase [Endozoicomonadaceae bacterium]|nr:leucyl/phenylalanyl-tRNA--protein transferase [Endozoicomonadaceae bacterium]